MSCMVERVARAYEPKLWAQIDADIGGGPFKSAAKFAREASLKNARAAIAAMREPLSEEMLNVGLDHVEGFLGYDCVRDMWQAMIDAALA